jgi:Uma2 family endonuclease
MQVETTRRRFNVEEYHRMAETGILSEDDRVELIDGEILSMSPIGPRHLAATDRATRLFVELAGDDAIARVQGSVRLGSFEEPQPDIVLLRPQPDFYASRFAGPQDVLLVLEVADSSLVHDRVTKGRIYAQAEIPEYWILNLNQDVLEVRRDPREGRYATVLELRRGEAISPLAFAGHAVAVESLLG